MTQYTFDENIVSDLHKDARGFRPSVAWMHAWETSSDEEKQDIWDSLIEEFEEEMDRERKAQAKALQNLEKRIAQVRRLGAPTEKHALKWIMEAEEFDDFDLRYGADYFCYHFGLSYSAKNDFQIQEAMNEMLALVE